MYLHKVSVSDQYRQYQAEFYNVNWEERLYSSHITHVSCKILSLKSKKVDPPISYIGTFILLCPEGVCQLFHGVYLTGHIYPVFVWVRLGLQPHAGYSFFTCSQRSYHQDLSFQFIPCGILHRYKTSNLKGTVYLNTSFKVQWIFFQKALSTGQDQNIWCDLCCWPELEVLCRSCCRVVKKQIWVQFQMQM